MLDLYAQENPDKGFSAIPVIVGCEQYQDPDEQASCIEGTIYGLLDEYFDEDVLPAYFRDDILMRVDVAIMEDGKIVVSCFSVEDAFREEIENLIKVYVKGIPGYKNGQPDSGVYTIPLVFEFDVPEIELTEKEMEEITELWEMLLNGGDLTPEMHSSFWEIIDRNGGEPENIQGIYHYKNVLNWFYNESQWFFDYAFMYCGIESMKTGEKVIDHNLRWYAGFVGETEWQVANHLLDKVVENPEASMDFFQKEFDFTAAVINKILVNLEILYDRSHNF